MKISDWRILIVLIAVLGIASCKDDDPVKPPVIISFSPESGNAADGGTEVIITGSNFSLTSTENTVTFNGVSATVSASTSTTITTVVPLGATTGKISVTVNGASAVSDADFIVTPVIISFFPESGNAADGGTEVIITGTDFSLTSTENAVTFNGVPATVSASTSTTITTVVPQGATTGKIGVAVNGISAVSATDFIVTPTNFWEQVADFPGAGRINAVTFSIGDKGYCGGGRGTGGSPLKDFWEYDSKTNAWTRIEDFGGGPRQNAAAFSIGGKGYVGTGSTTGSTRFKDIWEYDPATTHWTRKDDFGGTARDNAISVAVGTKGYIGGGISGASHIREKDFWEFDPSAAPGQQWTDKGIIGLSSDDAAINPGATSFAIETKGYFILPMDNGKVDLLEYNPQNNSWAVKKDVTENANSYTGFALGKRGYYVGNGKLWAYDPSTNDWMIKKEFPSNTVSNPVSFAIGKTGYAGIGNDLGAGPKKFFRYVPD